MRMSSDKQQTHTHTHIRTKEEVNECNERARARCAHITLSLNTTVHLSQSEPTNSR